MVCCSHLNNDERKDRCVLKATEIEQLALQITPRNTETRYHQVSMQKPNTSNVLCVQTV